MGRAGGGSAPRLSATGGILGLPQGWGDVFFPLGELRLFPSFRIRVGPWKHSKAGHGGGGGWQRWDLTAAPGPSRKALPQEQRRRQGRDAPLPTLHLAAGDVSHRQKCWVERKDAAPLTQLSRQPIPPARIAARRGWGGREAGCARALVCCCRASLGAQHPVVLQGPTACTPYGAGKGFSPHLHGWTLEGCRSSGTAGCAEQLNHTSPC